MTTYRNPFEGRSEPLPTELSGLGYRHEFAELDGIVLSYLRGPEAGPPLVLVPAQMGTWTTYAKVMPALAERFSVFVVELRGHGNSSWTPGNYSWDSVGGDLRLFLERMVGRPAVVSGNSSGGILALWLAANAPGLVSGIVLEDAPVFSVEMPRFAERDRFVYNGLAHIVEVLGDRENRHLADYFRGQGLPVSERRTKRMPGWFVDLLDRAITRYEQRHPGQPSGVDAWWLPASMGELFRSLSMFDPDFARAFVDRRFYGDFSHEAALRAVRCPLLLLHANWHRYAEHGLVGAMDDDDARRVCALVPGAVYRRIPANHVIHRRRPEEFVRAIEEFIAEIRGVPVLDVPPDPHGR
ncbi:alpha/beta hydrolase [Micromonospora sp. KC207]|uniref:alpha/beta fold hydrolase n=1 Tax=Micromonospora sp. KC207 TaxID=2530377 RepID=UPI001050E212|nr:alpha/beta hydrolase [Micromonospora sp. KC207]TDC59238.1 alpha/beta hydrolase [Micromonospora sp. KC207]